MEIISTLLNMVDIFLKFVIFMCILLFVGIPLLVSLIEKYLGTNNTTDDEKQYYKDLYDKSMEFMMNPRRDKNN